MSFLTFFFEQGFHRVFVMLAAVAVVLVAVVAVVALPRRRSHRGLAATVVVGAGAALLVAALGITLYEALALWYRPHGDGVMLRAAGYRQWALSTFVSLYVVIGASATAGGWVLGRRRARSGVCAALVIGFVTAMYLALTFPFVEFLNACNVGEPLVLDRMTC